MVTTFPDLAINEFLEEVQHITATGANFAHYYHATNIAIFINYISIILAIVTVFDPNFGIIDVSAIVILPLISIAALKAYNGFLYILDTKYTYKHIGYTIGFLIFINIFKVRAMYELIKPNNFNLISAIIAIFLLIFLLWRNKEFQHLKTNSFFPIVGIYIMLFCYSNLSLTYINCFFDTSHEEIHYVKILNKFPNPSNYSIELGAWEKVLQPERTTISPKLYKQLVSKSHATLRYKKGMLGWGWYTITASNKY